MICMLGSGGMSVPGDLWCLLFQKAKAKSEKSGFGKGVGGRHRVVVFQQKVEVSIDERNGIVRKGDCVSGNWE